MLNPATSSQLSGGPPHFVDLHVNPGESVSIQFFDGNETILRGPTTIKMISNHAYPPMPLPVQVPPGHMIQQIVDENGTLRHIILSALSGNGNANSNNCYTNSMTFAQSSQNGSFCCCCYQTCTIPVANGQTSSPLSSGLPAATASVMQSQLGHNPVFPLSNSYARNRRTNRTFSSPNSKRPPSNSFSNGPSYYGSTNSVASKVNGNNSSNNGSTISNSGSSRYGKSDNPKSNQYSRQSSNNLHSYDSTRPFDHGASDTKYYLNKSYDYSCNSSNASQASTIDQMNDNLKYYKEDAFCMEDDFAKKPFDMDKTSSTTKESIAFYLNHQPNVASDQEDSHRSSQSECTELSMNNSQSSANFELSFSSSGGKPGRIDLANHRDEPSHSAGELSDDFDSQKSTVPRADISTSTKPNGVIPTDSNSSGEANFSDKSSRRPKTAVISPHTAKSSSRRDSSSSADVSLSPSGGGSMNVATTAVQLSILQRATVPTKEGKCCCDAVDGECAVHNVAKPKPLANGNLEPYSGQSDLCDYVITPDDDDSEKSDSEPYAEEEDEDEEDEEEEEDSYRISSTITTPQRSPRHLLPKVEVITLSCSSLSSHSVRLKWSFSSLSSEYLEHKKHFIVDMLRGNVEDSPSKRIVYQGHNVTCRVPHLTPQKEYTFRVRTNTEAFVLTSNQLTVITEQLTSNGLKGRRAKQANQQLQTALVVAQNQQLQLAAEANSPVSASPSPSEMLMRARLSRDQRCAIFLLAAFTFAALIIAVLIQHWLGATN